MSTLRDRIEDCKDSIYQMYCVEGVSLYRISQELNLNRGVMSKVIKEDWGFNKAYVRQPTEEIRNSLRFYKERILEYCSDFTNRELPALLNELDITRGRLRSMAACDEDVENAITMFTNKPTIKGMSTTRRLEKEALWAEELKTLEGEVWKDVQGFEGRYMVSNLARVRSQVKILTPAKNPVTHRCEITLYKGGQSYTHRRYRLVALAFLPNPSNLPTVNHKNGNTTDDVLDNLEWASYSDQNHHRNKVLKRNIAKAYGKNGRFKKVVVDGFEFDTLRSACKHIGCSETQIQRYLSGETPTEHSIELVY